MEAGDIYTCALVLVVIQCYVIVVESIILHIFFL